ncbi:EAL domain-containing protein (putative c-di-GMP-specific phosphodiesterase class I) [Pseudomonas sp. TE36184]|jgi:EAL domain-containing protein (putative c-di-GMP-specific phosphodiesterase class I)
MPLSTPPRTHQRRYLTTAAWVLVPILLGILILYVQARLNLEQSTAQTASKIVREIDLMLDIASSTARQILPLAGNACDPFTQQVLREQVTRHPFVRSANSVWRNETYCSSLAGSVQLEELDPNNYVNGQLLLLSSKPVTGDSSYLIYRLNLGDQSALVTVNAYHLVNVLRLIGQDTELIFQAGSKWLSANGQIKSADLPLFPVAPSHLHSSRYSYGVEGGMPEGEIWRYMKSRYPALFCLILFFGMLSGAIGYQLQKVSSAPTYELQRAMAANEFIPYFQPVVNSQSGEWTGAEVLMRWQHPKEGLVSPDLFVPLAEYSGLIVPMTRSLLRQTASLLAPHSQLLCDGFHIAVNVTARHCHDMALVRDCKEFLNAFPDGRVKLVLELTERELVVPTEVPHKLFQELHELGVMIAIDDFGTGHSSLGYLRDFNVDYLKIDKSFVAMIGVDALSKHILDSIIELSVKLELGVVAEGVETSEQRDYLASKGVDLLQGYLFGRPVPSDVFVKGLRPQ